MLNIFLSTAKKIYMIFKIRNYILWVKIIGVNIYINLLIYIFRNKIKIDLLNEYNYNLTNIIKELAELIKEKFLNEKDNISSEVLNETFDFIDSLEYQSETAISNLSKLFEIKNLNTNK